MTEPAPTIFARLNAVAGDLTAIPKQQVDAGAGGRYKAFAIDDIYSHLRPLFTKHGVVVIPSFAKQKCSVSEKGRNVAQVTIDYTFWSVTGDSVTMRFGAEGHDGQDKATNKAAQQALKYGLIQMFQISTGEVDPDAAVIEDVAEVEPSAADIRLKAVKDAAWHATDPTLDKDTRIAEAKATVDQVLESWGGPPKTKKQVEEIIGYIESLTNKETE